MNGPVHQPSERQAWIALAGTPGVGDVTFGRLLAIHGSASEAIASIAGLPAGRADRRLADDLAMRARRGLAASIRASAADPTALERRMQALGGWILTPLDSGYPARLHAIEEPPPLLYGLGDAAALEQPRMVAVVGTRRADRHRTRPGLTHRPATGRGRRAGGVGPGDRHRRRGASRCARGWRPDGRRRRQRPGRPGARGPPSPGAPHHRAWRGHRRAGAGRPGLAGNVPATEPHHQRPGRRDHRGRGARAQRRAHHGQARPGAGTGPARGDRPPPRCPRRRLPGHAARVAGATAGGPRRDDRRPRLRHQR